MKFKIHSKSSGTSSTAFAELSHYLNKLKNIGKFEKVEVINSPRPFLDFLDCLQSPNTLFISIFGSNIDYDACGLTGMSRLKISKDKRIELRGSQNYKIDKYTQFPFTVLLKDENKTVHTIINYNTVYILFNLLDTDGNIKEILDYIIPQISKLVKKTKKQSREVIERLIRDEKIKMACEEQIKFKQKELKTEEKKIKKWIKKRDKLLRKENEN